MADEIIKLLERLSELLSPTAQRVWQMTRHQVLVDAWGSIAWGILLLGIVGTGTYLLLYFYRKAEAENDDRYYDKEPYIMGSVALGVISLFVVPGGCALLWGGIRVLLNPDFFVMMQLLSRAR